MKSETAAEMFLRMVFRSEAWNGEEWVAAEAFNASLGPELWLSLATGDPGAAGSQESSELAYKGFARQSVSRAFGKSDWHVEGRTASLTKRLRFGAREDVGATEYVYWTLGTKAKGPGDLLMSGPLFLEAPVPFTVVDGRIVCPRRPWELEPGDRVMFVQAGDAGLPKDVSTSVAYHAVKPMADGFYVAATEDSDPGHPGDGSGLVGLVQPRVVRKEDDPQIRPGALRVFEE